MEVVCELRWYHGNETSSFYRTGFFYFIGTHFYEIKNIPQGENPVTACQLFEKETDNYENL